MLDSWNRVRGFLLLVSNLFGIVDTNNSQLFIDSVGLKPSQAWRMELDDDYHRKLKDLFGTFFGVRPEEKMKMGSI